MIGVNFPGRKGALGFVFGGLRGPFFRRIALQRGEEHRHCPFTYYASILVDDVRIDVYHALDGALLLYRGGDDFTVIGYQAASIMDPGTIEFEAAKSVRENKNHARPTA